MKTLDKKQILEKTDKPVVFRELIPKFKETKQSQAVGLCPAHDDSNASLSMDTMTGAVHCFACGFKGGLVDVVMKVKVLDFKPALYWLAERAGIDTTQVTPKGKTGKPRCIATFYYTDTEGKRLYWKERIEPGRNGRKKEFIFYHLDKAGKKQTGRGGVEAVPYRLHEIVKAETVYILEGEAKSDLVASWGLAATCLDSGAKSKWHDRYTGFFEGKEVIIVPDNDTAGEEYLQTIATALHGKVKSLKVLRLPGLKEKGDILDWIKQGGRADA